MESLRVVEYVLINTPILEMYCDVVFTPIQKHFDRHLRHNSSRSTRLHRIVSVFWHEPENAFNFSSLGPAVLACPCQQGILHQLLSPTTLSLGHASASILRRGSAHLHGWSFALILVSV